MKPAANIAVENHQQAKSARIFCFGGSAVILLLTLLAYIPALHGQFVWDDDSWTTNIAGLLRDFSGLRAIWFQPTAMQQYYPLAGTSFWIDYHLWGFWPLPYHVENICLHAISSILFWRLLRRLKVPGAWLAGAIFAVHPVMVESVAWITERKNVLSLVLYLSALMAYGRFTGFWEEENDPLPRRWGAYALAFVLFIGALLTKTTAFSFPAVILLINWWKRGRVRLWGDINPIEPFFVISIGFCAVTSYLEKHHVGAKGPEWDISFPQRCLIAGHVFWFYIGKLLWPVNLCFLYPRWQLNAGSLAQWLFPITAVGAMFALFFARGKIGRGPITAALFYVGTLFPSLGFLNAYFMRYSFVCDHWTYLSSLGLIALAAALIPRLAIQLRLAGAYLIFCPVLLAVLATLTWRQTKVYGSLETLWDDTLAKNPDAWLAHNNLGIVLRDRGDVSGAIAHYQEAIRLNPNYELAHNNLGVALKNQGKLDEAMAQYEIAVKLNPRFPDAYYNLGVVQDILGKNNEALASYQQALSLEPDSFEPHYAAAGLLARMGKIPEAVDQYTQALAIQPDSVKAHNKLGIILAQQGNLQDAIQQWSETLQLDPGNSEAHYNMGIALEKLGRDDDAIEQYRESIRITPNFFQPHYALGKTMMRLGKIPEALEQLSDAVAIQPDSADAQHNLALVLWQSGRAADAIAHWNLALRSEPDFPDAENDLAWVLATTPPAQGGDPARAVDLAKKASDSSGNQEPGYLDTLAVAYASAGRFSDAIAADEKAADLARAAGQSQLVDQIQARLQLYRGGHATAPPADTTNPTTR
jgi:protein O-mannosyl-transferase